MVDTVIMLLLLSDPTPWLPPLSDLGVFPDVDTAVTQVNLYRQHLEWVEWMAVQPVIDGRCDRRYWQEAKRQTLERLQTWELLMQAHGRLEDFRGWGIPPRVFLGQLRDALPAYDYAAGRMPPVLERKWIIRIPEERSGINQ